MSNEIIKKAKIASASLPPLNSETLKYDMRYRIISEDKKLFSHWSPTISVDPGYTFVSGNINLASNSGVVNITWDSVDIKIGTALIQKAKEYDIWIKWSRSNAIGDWIKKERMSSTSIAFPIPSTYFINGVDQAQAPNRFQIEVYLIGSPVTRDFTGLRVYNPALHTV
jgi:hypothetical protein